jgi:hypothetical protein
LGGVGNVNLTKIKIDDVKLAKYNPRKDLKAGMEEYEKIKMSIETFGYVDPIIANIQTKNIVGGHQRWKVLKDLGYAEIDIVYVDIDLKTEKSLNVALNKISGEWDMVKLKDLMIEFDTADIFHSGFTDSEIEDILKRFEIPEFEEREEREKKKNFITCPHCGEEFEPS